MHGNNFNNNEFTDQIMNNNNMPNQNNYNNSGQNNINYNSFDTRMCTNDNDLQNKNNFFGNNYQEYFDNKNNKMVNYNNADNNQNNNQNINQNINQNNNQNINQNLLNNSDYYNPDDNNTLTLSHYGYTKKQFIQKNMINRHQMPENSSTIIQPGNFNQEEIEDIKKICIDGFDTSIPFDQTNIDKISQKLKLKYEEEWFVLVCEQSSPKDRLNFDFKFSNLDSKDVLIFSHYNFRFYIGKIKNINN